MTIHTSISHAAKLSALGCLALLASLLGAGMSLGGCDDECTGRTCVRVCQLDGKAYLPGHEVPAADKCQSCMCDASGELRCSDITCCSVDGQTYSVREQFPAGDDCNVCVCDDDGTVSCTRSDCANTVSHCDTLATGEGAVIDEECNDCVCLSDGQIGCPRKSCTCEFEGKTLTRGEWFANACNDCWCGADGVVTCTERVCATCTANGQTYPYGASYFDGATCSTCICGESCMSSRSPCFCEIGGKQYLWRHRTLPDGCNTATCRNTQPGAGEWEIDQPVRACPPVAKIVECKSSASVEDVSTYLEGDRLGLSLTCREDAGATADFTACFDPVFITTEAGDEVHIRSEPMGTTSPCTPSVPATRVIDVSPIADLWRSQHADPSGHVILRIGQSSEVYQF